MSVVKYRVQKLFRDFVKEGPVPFIHCASLNLNLVIYDAVQCNAQVLSFLETLVK